MKTTQSYAPLSPCFMRKPSLRIGAVASSAVVVEEEGGVVRWAGADVSRAVLGERSAGVAGLSAESYLASVLFACAGAGAKAAVVRDSAPTDDDTPLLSALLLAAALTSNCNDFCAVGLLFVGSALPPPLAVTLSVLSIASVSFIGDAGGVDCVTATTSVVLFYNEINSPI